MVASMCERAKGVVSETHRWLRPGGFGRGLPSWQAQRPQHRVLVVKLLELQHRAHGRR